MHKPARSVDKSGKSDADTRQARIGQIIFFKRGFQRDAKLCRHVLGRQNRRAKRRFVFANQFAREIHQRNRQRVMGNFDASHQMRLTTNRQINTGSATL